MILPNNQHLTYCSNIHFGETWIETFNALKDNIPSIKNRLSPDKPFGIGLRLSNKASEELNNEVCINEFKNWLAQTNTYVFTMNGFPYGGFHKQHVKDDVHKPDWTTPERLEYTKRLATILSSIMEGAEGGISTSPISYKHWLDTAEEKLSVLKKGAESLVNISYFLLNIENERGKFIHIDIEPEPDGLIENSNEMRAFYKYYLVPAAIRFWTGHGKSESEAEAIIKKYIQVCYDVCHFAVAYEDHAIAIESFEQEGIKIGKIQISAALKIQLSIEEKNRELARHQLIAFEDSTYLHQVIQKNRDGSFTQFPDLPEALVHIHHADALEWRVHFHVPIFKESYHTVKSTQTDILEVIEINKQKPFTSHLEVETYTWEVLPKEERLELKASIIRELEWVKFHV